MKSPSPLDLGFMRQALRLARRGYGQTSPNPMVGAILVRGGKVIGRGWHRRAGEPHAEIEAMRDAARKRESIRGATLYVTLEPCSTHGRTPPCTQALIESRISANKPRSRECWLQKQIRPAAVELQWLLLALPATVLKRTLISSPWSAHSRRYV